MSRNTSNAPRQSAPVSSFLAAFITAPKAKEAKDSAKDSAKAEKPVKVTSQEVNTLVGEYVTGGFKATPHMVATARETLPKVYDAASDTIRPNAFATRATRSTLTFRAPDGSRVSGLAFRLYVNVLREIASKSK